MESSTDPPAAPVQAIIQKVRYFEDPVYQVTVYRFRVRVKVNFSNSLNQFQFVYKRYAQPLQKCQVAPLPADGSR